MNPTTQKYNLLVLSDLHINEGWLFEQDRYSQREDFFYDEAFFSLLRYHHELHATPRYKNAPWLLILNGDTFDFEQVVALPEEGEELVRICQVSTYEELGDRARFGLGTSVLESRWKLARIARGHPLFFAALGWFVAHGNHVMVIKGNHDPELYWSTVQRDLRQHILNAYRAYQVANPSACPSLKLDDIKSAVQFEPWFYYDTHFHLYIEHGNQYEPSNHFPDHLHPIQQDNPALLALPQGMLMTRYVLNRLEESYPYADNVRPLTRVFGWMMSDNPLRGMLVFLARSGDLFWGWRQIEQQHGVQATVPRVSSANDLPLSYHGLSTDVLQRIQALAQERAQFSWETWGRMALDQGALGVLNLSGMLAGLWGLLSTTKVGKSREAIRWLLAAFVLLNSGHFWSTVVNDDRRLDYMPDVAAELAMCFRSSNTPLHAVILGHTHIARRDLIADEKVWMLNTGSWIPTLVQYPYHWVLRLTFVRVAVDSDPQAPPEFLEWDPKMSAPRYPRHLGG